MTDLPADILSLIFEQLLGDCLSLSRLSRAAKAWHSLCLPFLLHTVDLSCHNLGRLPELETDRFLNWRAVECDYADNLRPHDKLVARQRAFLRLMVNKPQLASYVRSFTWTLIWYDFDDDSLTHVDRQTWSVFQRFVNVSKLDLASLHEIGNEPYIRQSPARLFPAIADLRLVGWMHRGLVKAIVQSLDVHKLRSLELDHLQDEGILPNGMPMSDEINTEFAASSHNMQGQASSQDDFKPQQEEDESCIFPGPMWLPLRLLCSRPVSSLRVLHINLGAFDDQIETAKYRTMFKDIADFIVRLVTAVRRSPSLIVGEHDLLILRTLVPRPAWNF